MHRTATLSRPNFWGVSLPRKPFAVVALVLLLAPLAFVALAKPAAAAASSVTYTVSGGSLSTGWSPPSSTINLPKFDPAEGTLTGVTVTLQAKEQCSGNVQNRYGGQSIPAIDPDASSTISNNADIKCDGKVTLTKVDGTLISQASTLFSGMLSFAYPGGVYTGNPANLQNGGSDTKPFTGNTNTVTDTHSYTDATTLAQFNGPGTISLPAYCQSNNSATGRDGDIGSFFNTKCFTLVNAAYTYIPKAKANPDTYTVPADTTSPLDSTTGSNGTTGVVCANDDGQGGTLDYNSVTVTTPPSHGTLTYDASNCTFHYTPSPGYDGGPDTFQYKICDDAAQPATCSSPTTVNIYVVVPDMTVVKTSSPATFAAGGQAMYTLTVKNSGNSPTVGTYKVVDTLPTGLSYVSADPGCTQTLGTVTCSSNDVLAANATKAWTVTVNVGKNAGTGNPKSVTNNAHVSGGGEHQTTNNDSSVTNPVVSGSVLSITKTGDKTTVQPGDTVTYTVTVKNTGPSPTFDGATVVDQLPAPDGLNIKTADGHSDFSCTIDTPNDNVTCDTTHELAVNASATITITAQVDAGAIGTQRNTATVTSPDDSTGPHSAQYDVTVPALDLYATKAANASSFPLGGSGSYTLTLGNNGPSNAGAVSVTEQAGTGLTITGVDTTGSGFSCMAPCSGSSVTLTRASLDSAESHTVTVNVVVAANAPNPVANTVTIGQAGQNPLIDTNPKNDTETINTPTGRDAPLSIKKSSDASFSVGADGHYAITVQNTGTSPTTGNVSVDDTLPTGITAQLPITGSGLDCTSSTITVVHCNTTAALAANGSFTINVVVNVAKAAYDTSGHEVTNKATASGGTNPPPDSTVDTPVKAAALGDFVWNDVNANGIQDSGEAGVANVTVQLLNSGGTVITSTTTDANGKYLFDGLAAGTYKVNVVAPASAVFTTEHAPGSTAANDSDVNSSGATAAITLAATQRNLDTDAGLVQTNGTVNGNVYIDHNNNGILDAGEAGIGSVKVTLTGTDALGNAVNLTINTAADGSYSFTGLAPGTYSVTETQPAGYLDGQTTSPNGGTVANNVVSAIAVNGATVADVDFGELRPGSIGKTVWNDTNANGVHDAGEPGVSGVVVTLTGTDDHGDAVTKSTTTDSTGTFDFTGLRPGTYTVTVTKPAGMFFTQTGKDSDADLLTGITTPVVDLVEGDVAERDAGVLNPVSIDGKSFYDKNGNGVYDQGELPKPGVAVTVIGIDDLGNTVTKTFTTDGNGNFSVTGLRPGTYTVTGGTVSVVKTLLPGAHLHVDIPFPGSGIEGEKTTNPGGPGGNPGGAPNGAPNGVSGEVTSSSAGGLLAYTGVNAMRGALGALGLLLLGAALVLAGRKRRGGGPAPIGRAGTFGDGGPWFGRRSFMFQPAAGAVPEAGGTRSAGRRYGSSSSRRRGEARGRTSRVAQPWRWRR